VISDGTGEGIVDGVDDGVEDGIGDDVEDCVDDGGDVVKFKTWGAPYWPAEGEGVG